MRIRGYACRTFTEKIAHMAVSTRVVAIRDAIDVQWFRIDGGTGNKKIAVTENVAHVATAKAMR